MVNSLKFFFPSTQVTRHLRRPRRDPPARPPTSHGLSPQSRLSTTIFHVVGIGPYGLPGKRIDSATRVRRPRQTEYFPQSPRKVGLHCITLRTARDTLHITSTSAIFVSLFYRSLVPRLFYAPGLSESRRHRKNVSDGYASGVLPSSN